MASGLSAALRRIRFALGGTQAIRRETLRRYAVLRGQMLLWESRPYDPVTVRIVHGCVADILELTDELMIRLGERREP